MNEIPGPAYAGQTTTLEQYQRSGMQIPQVDAIRRSRMTSSSPLYGASGDVMGGAKPMPEVNGGIQRQPGMMDAMGNKRGMVAPNVSGLEAAGQQVQGARDLSGLEAQSQSMYGAKPAMMGAPSGRGLPQAARPAPIIRDRRSFR